MSDDMPQEVEAEEVENTTKKTREAAEQSRALNTLTDHVNLLISCQHNLGKAVFYEHKDQETSRLFT